MKTNNKQAAANKAAAMNEKLNLNGNSGQRYGVAEDIRTGKYVPATMAQIFNSQYLRIVI